MIRRLLPYLLMVFLVLIDISVVPVFTAGLYVMPLALVFAMCTGQLLGRLHGLLCGMVGGLLVDILAGVPLGYMMLTYLLCGFFAGMGGYDSDEVRAQEGYSRLRAFFRRAVVVFVVLGIFETVTMVYQYFNTALFMGVYVKNALIRMAAGTALTCAAYYLAMPMLVGRASARVLIGMKRVVKNL